MLCDELGLYAADSMYAEDAEQALPPFEALTLDEPVGSDLSALDRRLIAILRSLDR
ncbi:MAG TPA: hypothetical protein P5298_00390 [Spirochaetia bacterium]|nr:hypothetical protein [Spirochaetaceae bacterium]HPE89746.1 hypothetical protein [Spirochaetales bacterium]HRW22849.1 hypothetical protein [Spirochaetia bacterium]